MNHQSVLKDVSSDKAFWFKNGVKVTNIYELARELKSCDAAIFSYHVTSDRDDFAAWIGGVIGDFILAERLRHIKNQNAYIKSIERRITYHERLATMNTLRKIVFANTFEWMISSGIIKKVVILILILLTLSLIYVQYQSLQHIEKLNEKLSLLEQKNACYNQYYDQRITSIAKNVPVKELECLKEYSLPLYDDVERRPAIISSDDIIVLPDRVIIKVNNASWATFTNSSSMLPVINHNTRSIEITPQSMDSINIGDVVAYTRNQDIIIHRVISKGVDDIGPFLIMKGDNNPVVDAQKVRFEEVTGVVIAFIY